MWLFHEMKVFSVLTILALLFASMKRSSHSATSSTSISFLWLTRAKMLAGVRSWSAYRKLTFTPRSAMFSSAGSVIANPSVLALNRIMVLTSSELYVMVGIMITRATRSGGMPWAATSSSVPRIVHFPRFEARMTMGEIDDSRARLR